MKTMFRGGPLPSLRSPLSASRCPRALTFTFTRAST